VIDKQKLTICPTWGQTVLSDRQDFSKRHSRRRSQFNRMEDQTALPDLINAANHRQ